jgi:ribonuclease P protein component
LPAALDRLKKRSEFLAVAATNRRWTAPGLVLQVRPLPISDNAETLDATRSRRTAGLRVGFTATKKIGNAVKRNRARRRLRAAVREVLSGAHTKPADLVLVARHGTIARPYAELKSDIAACLRRLGVVG